MVDLSNPIPYADPNGSSYSTDVQLIGSRDSLTATPDGNFGTLGQAGLGSSGTGFTIVPNTVVTLYSYDATTKTWAPTAAGRQRHPAGPDLALGNHARRPTTTGSTCPTRSTPPATTRGSTTSTATSSTASSWATPRRPWHHRVPRPALHQQPVPRDLQLRRSALQRRLPPGHVRRRRRGRSLHDLVRGRAPGDTIPLLGADGQPSDRAQRQPADADRQQHRLCPARLRGRSLLPSTAPDGSLAKPYSALAPEGNPNTAPANPTHDPNGGLNSSQFFLSGFNTAVRPQRQRRLRPVGPLRRLATGVPGPRRGRRPAGHAPAQSDHGRGHPADLRAPGAGRVQPGHQQRQRLGPLRHDAGLRPRVDAQVAERVALRAEPGQCDPGAGRLDPVASR